MQDADSGEQSDRAHGHSKRRRRLSPPLDSAYCAECPELIAIKAPCEWRDKYGRLLPSNCELVCQLFRYDDEGCQHLVGEYHAKQGEVIKAGFDVQPYQLAT